MGIEIKNETVGRKEIKRCKSISIQARYNEVPTITQTYEVVTLIDDEFFKCEDVANICFNITDLYDVDIEVNGKTLTGAEVAQFFFIYNDMPKE